MTNSAIVFLATCSDSVSVAVVVRIELLAMTNLLISRVIEFSLIGLAPFREPCSFISFAIRLLFASAVA